jgi:hypothetical protein
MRLLAGIGACFGAGRPLGECNDLFSPIQILIKIVCLLISSSSVHILDCER